MSVIAALTLLPAVLSLLGDRINSLKLPYLGRRLIDNRAAGRTSWIARVAQRAMKRPALALVVGVGVLLLRAYPALDMKTGVSGVSTFPNSFESKQGFAVLETAVLGRRREPGADRRRRPGDHAGRPGRPSTRLTQRARRRHGVRARPGADGQGRHPGAALGARSNGDAVGDLALTKVRELRGTLVPRAFAGSGRPRLRHRPDRRQRRLHRHREPLLPLGRRARAQPQLPAAAGRLPLRRHPGSRRSS